ncbi:chemotaxis protein [Oceanobacillus saliphilus]|uniref:chemotaxis protein n=1 Tax=Oceanobacillus saliphilus TaxID=2925834 RepID=UPI00201D3375|nr:chemotaxis protein [Oceanobacillus saliphilus]
MSDYNDGILLKSGTNELEIILFELAGESYAMNVLKVREIITPIPITKIPNSHKSVEGIIYVRGEIISVVNLARILNIAHSENPENDKFIIAELNQMKIAFRVDEVKRINRISWEQIEKPNELSVGQQPYATGIIKHHSNALSIFLDIEKIVVEINPELGGTADTIKTLGPRERSTKRIIVAEDSGVLRALLKDTLTEAGYEYVTFFQNGREAWEYLESLAEEESVVNPYNQVQLLLTDIEMPQMDGHHLTYRVKQDARLKNIPVIIFSSLITDDLYHKGEEVGAVSQISKPKLVELVKEIDKYIL